MNHSTNRSIETSLTHTVDVRYAPAAAVPYLKGMKGRGGVGGWWPNLGLSRALQGLLLGLACFTGSAAHAQFATGGSGVLRNSILWFSWGAHGAGIPNSGLSVTNSYVVGGTTLAVTCSLSGISGAPSLANQFRVYRPGTFGGDGQDNLYNIGGTGTSNTLVSGVSTSAATSNLTFTCSATLGGNPYPLKGLVFADSEQSGGGEFISATVAAGATVRLIDRFRSCNIDQSLIRTVNTYRLENLSGNCNAGGTGPMAVVFLEGVSTGNLTMRGNGISAMSLGVVIHYGEFGDAPASYGVASHLVDYTFTGGTVAANSTTGVFTLPLAALSQPINAIVGSRADTESGSLHSVNSLGDDSNQSPDDEDGVNVAGLPLLTSNMAGSAYAVPVTCVGTSPIRGWIDFNRDGDFLDAGESSINTPNCATGAATLNWTIPTGIISGDSYLRVRTAISATQIATPAGIAASGEVEDHAITISVPPTADLAITKTNNLPGTVDLASDTVTRGQSTTYRIVVTNNGPTAVTGAVVTDTATGLTCTTLTCASSSGSSCPVAPTVAQLTGAGITLLALPVSGTVTLNLTCTVN